MKGHHCQCFTPSFGCSSFLLFSAFPLTHSGHPLSITSFHPRTELLMPHTLDIYQFPIIDSLPVALNFIAKLPAMYISVSLRQTSSSHIDNSKSIILPYWRNQTLMHQIERWHQHNPQQLLFEHSQYQWDQLICWQAASCLCKLSVTSSSTTQQLLHAPSYHR